MASRRPHQAMILGPDAVTSVIRRRLVTEGLLPTLHNLIADPAHIATRSELRRKRYELMNRFGDPYGDVGDEKAGGSVGNRPNRYNAPRYLPRS